MHRVQEDIIINHELKGIQQVQQGMEDKLQGMLSNLKPAL